jgi:WD40 repeat protein
VGLDVCCRKPLLVSCSTDKSIRLWNYITGNCEMMRYYPEEAYSVAFHPSGLYLLVGFSDKLRLMNVLMDDFRFFKEFAIRACKEVSWIICIYSSVDFQTEVKCLLQCMVI